MHRRFGLGVAAVAATARISVDARDSSHDCAATAGSRRLHLAHRRDVRRGETQFLRALHGAARTLATVRFVYGRARSGLQPPLATAHVTRCGPAPIIRGNPWWTFSISNAAMGDVDDVAGPCELHVKLTDDEKQFLFCLSRHSPVDRGANKNLGRSSNDPKRTIMAEQDLLVAEWYHHKELAIGWITHPLAASCVHA